MAWNQAQQLRLSFLIYLIRPISTNRWRSKKLLPFSRPSIKISIWSVLKVFFVTLVSTRIAVSRNSQKGTKKKFSWSLSWVVTLVVCPWRTYRWSRSRSSWLHLEHHHQQLLSNFDCLDFNSLDFGHRTNLGWDCLSQRTEKSSVKGKCGWYSLWIWRVYRPTLPSWIQSLDKGDYYVLEFSSLWI